MAPALTLLLISCLLQSALCGQSKVIMPQTIEVLRGSCVTIPCSFDIEIQYERYLDETCKALWRFVEWKQAYLSNQWTAVFDSRNPQTSTINGRLTGDLRKKDCTTTLNNMTSEYSRTYYLRVECETVLKHNFAEQSLAISVRDDPPRPTVTPSTLKVKEGTPVTMKCSAPAPCLSHPPTLTWTSSLGDSQESMQENEDKTEVKTSVLTFTASHIHHKQGISCTAVYSKQDGSAESSVSTSLTADISYSPKDTKVSVSPSGPVPEDSIVTLTCSSTANPAATSYTWYRADGGLETFIGTGHVLNITASKDSGPFFCKAENDLGAGRSNISHIDVQYSPKDTKVSVSPSGPVPEESIVSLTCSNTANPAATSYTWYRADGGLETFIGTGHVLNITASKDSGPFFCKAENDLGAGRSNISHIDVQYSPKDTIVSASPSGPVPEDSIVSLTCSSTANPAVLRFSWYRADGGQKIFIGTGHVLNITASKDSGPFFCKAENVLGAGRSNISHIDVQFAPQILPSSDCTKTADQLNCSCDTVGNPSPTLQWYLDGSPVNHSDKFAISNESLNDTGLRSFITVKLQERDLPTLLCHSSNSLGSASQRFYIYSFQPQTSAESQVMIPAFIATVVALLVLICALLLVIRAQRTHHNLPKNTVAMSQLLTSGEGNEVANTTEEDVYVNASVPTPADVTHPAAVSEQNGASLQSSGPTSAEGSSKSSEKIEEGTDVIYSSVNWKSKSKRKKVEDTVDMDQPGTSYLEEERSMVGGMNRNFVSNALEMGNLYDEAQPRSVKKEVECEYAQVKFKNKSVMRK